MTTALERGRWFPDMPPALPDETDEQYTNRLTGADRTGRVPYDHRRNRQCSIGYHGECSDPDGETCQCPCHTEGAPQPKVRVTRIDLGEDEEPEGLHLTFDGDARSAIAADFDVEALTIGPHGLYLSMGAAADMARHYGRVSGLGHVETDFYCTIVNVANRWWDDGLNEAPTAGVVARGGRS